MGLLGRLFGARYKGGEPARTGSRFDEARRAARLFGDPTLPVARRPASLIERIGLTLRVRLAASVLDRLPGDMRLLLARLGGEPPVPPTRGRR